MDFGNNHRSGWPAPGAASKRLAPRGIQPVKTGAHLSDMLLDYEIGASVPDRNVTALSTATLLSKLTSDSVSYRVALGIYNFPSPGHICPVR